MAATQRNTTTQNEERTQSVEVRNKTPWRTRRRSSVCYASALCLAVLGYAWLCLAMLGSLGCAGLWCGVMWHKVLLSTPDVVPLIFPLASGKRFKPSFWYVLYLVTCLHHSVATDVLNALTSIISCGCVLAL